MSQDERWEMLGEPISCLDFGDIPNKRSKRPDLHAMLLLESIFPDRDGDMVCSAGHDQIWLDFGEEESEKLTDEQIRELCLCGVFFDNGLSMFV